MKKISKQIETVVNSHNFYKDKIKSLGIDSYSGRGSCVYTTEDVRKHIPIILNQYNIKSVVDSPCGDWNWMKELDLSGVSYIGYDVVEEVLENNKKKYGNDETIFQWKDLLNEDFNEKADLIICRDFLFHISTADALMLLKKFKASGSKYLLSTSFDKTTVNSDINPQDNGYGFRQINLLIEPFNMLNPIYSFLETHPDNAGRSMYLWKLNE